jgi:hypothetical protein
MEWVGWGVDHVVPGESETAAVAYRKIDPADRLNWERPTAEFE